MILSLLLLNLLSRLSAYLKLILIESSSYAEIITSKVVGIFSGRDTETSISEDRFESI
jgi:hypothetical protein